MALLEEHGADAVRWFFAATGSPWGTRKVRAEALEDIVRRVLLTYWNTASFLVRYARAAAAGGGEAAAAPPPAARPALDRWLLSELHILVRDVTADLEGFDSAAAGRRIAAFIDDLSNWYLRRSRRRLRAGPAAPDGAAAFATLHTALETLTRLMAPFTPFVTDYLWDVLRPAGAPDSVHLAAWPTADAGLIDEPLAGQMALARRLVELGRSARAGAAVRVRQPLARALAGAAGFEGLPAELRDQVSAELNVARLEPLAAGAGTLVSYAARPAFRALGARFGRATPAVAAAIEAADPAALAAGLRERGSVTVPVDGAPVELGPAEVVITELPRAGWAVAAEGGETVALEVTITPELRREGYAREFVRLVQEARKGDGLEVTDRIALRWATADPELAAALAEHGELIAAEVLAASYGPAAADSGAGAEPDGGPSRAHADRDLGLTFWLRRVP
jgi:isoleucyl-tRNA synthetase